MFLAGTMAIERSEMPGCAVSGMLGKSVHVKSTVKLVHEAIARHFRDDRRGGDAEAERVAVNEPGLRGGVFHQKSVTQQAIGFQREIVDGAFEGNAVRRAKSEHIDFLCFHNSHRNAER